MQQERLRVSTPPDFETLLAKARAAQASGGHAEAIVLAGQAADAAAASGAFLSQANALHLLAGLQKNTGATEDAAKNIKNACQLFEAEGAEGALCDALIELGSIYMTLGLLDEALDAVMRSLNLAILREDRRAIFWAYNRTGVIHTMLGDPLQGLEFLRAGLAMAEGQGGYENFCIRNNLADNALNAIAAYHGLGQTSEAELCLEHGILSAREALSLAAGDKHPYREALARVNLGLLLAMHGEFEAAETQFEAVAALAEANGFAGLTAASQHYRARAALLQGDAARAIPGLHNVLDHATSCGEKPLITELHLQLAQAYEAAGAADKALKHYKAHHAAERDCGTAIAQTRIRLVSNLLELRTSKIEAERARLEAAWERSRSDALEAEKRQLQLQSEELSRHAHQDALTGLWNRRYIDSRLPALLERTRQAAKPFCMALADLDLFKKINDQFGHAIGDQVLVRTAGLLQASARPADIVARFGGEEFLLVFPELDLAGAADVCEKLREKIAAHEWSQIHKELQVTLSFGVTRAQHCDVAAALHNADTLLYDAKREGRNRVKAG
jgi:diguanylate cyclase (GGDEF)-like protein